LKPSEKMYWIKVGLAIVAAVLSIGLQVYAGVDGTLVFLIGVLLYMGSSEVMSNVFKLDKSHGLKVGVGAYVFIWVMLWTLLYTVFKTAPV
jgi:hypothetical protein